MKIILPGDKKNMNYIHIEGVEPPIEQAYIPKPGDIVVGKIIAEKKNVAYIVDIFSFYAVSIMMRNINLELKINDFVMGTIGENAENMENIKLLRNTVIITVPPSKLAKIIGTKGQTLKLITELSGSKIGVGRNGVVWIQEGDIAKALEIIDIITKRAHLKELNEYIYKKYKGDKNEK